MSTELIDDELVSPPKCIILLTEVSSCAQFRHRYRRIKSAYEVIRPSEVSAVKRQCSVSVADLRCTSCLLVACRELSG